jgi:hypothetical protein
VKAFVGAVPAAGTDGSLGEVRAAAARQVMNAAAGTLALTDLLLRLGFRRRVRAGVDMRRKTDARQRQGH